METLSEIYAQAKQTVTQEEINQINLRLFLLVQLSSLQINIAYEIEDFFKKKGQYNLKLKHNHEKIKKFIRGCGNPNFYKNLTNEQIGALGDDADVLEKAVYEWVGLKKI